MSAGLRYHLTAGFLCVAGLQAPRRLSPRGGEWEWDWLNKGKVHFLQSIISQGSQTGLGKITQETLHVFRVILESVNLELFLLDNANLQNKACISAPPLRECELTPRKHAGAVKKDHG